MNFICNEKPAEKWNEIEFLEDLQRIARPIIKKEAATRQDIFYNGECPNYYLIKTYGFHRRNFGYYIGRN